MSAPTVVADPATEETARDWEAELEAIIGTPTPPAEPLTELEETPEVEYEE